MTLTSNDISSEQDRQGTYNVTLMSNHITTDDTEK